MTAYAQSIFDSLKYAVEQQQVVTLLPEHSEALLSWANQVTEDKNAVVRENHVLASKLMEQHSAPSPASSAADSAS